MPDGLKTCPDCAEEVKAAANVCRFCGYRFDAEATREADAEERATRAERGDESMGAYATFGPKLRRSPREE